jgi:malate/lactate dehydrogenase
MKAGIVGVGKLGGTIAFALARESSWDEIVLVDVVPKLAWAQAEDVRHGVRPSAATRVRPGRVEDLEGSDVIVLCAGQGRKPGMTRLDLLQTNAGVVDATSAEVARVARNATLVVLTNPMDVMTTVAWRSTGWARERVIGSGTLLDSMRLRAILADRFGVSMGEVDATALGEHGERVVPIFSRARIVGEPLELPDDAQREIAQQLRDVSGRIIEAKGGTAFGPAGTTADLVRALVQPEPRLMPCSVALQGEYGVRDVAMGVPALLGGGRVKRVEEWPLPPDEREALRAAAEDLAGHAEDAQVVLELVPTARKPVGSLAAEPEHVKVARAGPTTREKGPRDGFGAARRLDPGPRASRGPKRSPRRRRRETGRS